MPPPLFQLQGVFINITQLILPLGGIALLFMLIMGGLRFISSGGDPRKAGEARSILTYAVMGVVLLAFGYFFIRLISAITGNEDILRFAIFR